jgi:hypothetical protein
MQLSREFIGARLSAKPNQQAPVRLLEQPQLLSWTWRQMDEVPSTSNGATNAIVNRPTGISGQPVSLVGIIGVHRLQQSYDTVLHQVIERQEPFGATSFDAGRNEPDIR